MQDPTDTVRADVALTWAYHEALRRFGFPADDIFVAPSYDARTGQLLARVELRRDGREFVIDVAVLRDEADADAFGDAWRAFARDVACGAVAECALQALWDRCKAQIPAGELVVALQAKGFRMPAVVNREKAWS